MPKVRIPHAGVYAVVAASPAPWESSCRDAALPSGYRPIVWAAIFFTALCLKRLPLCRQQAWFHVSSSSRLSAKRQARFHGSDMPIRLHAGHNGKGCHVSAPRWRPCEGNNDAPFVIYPHHVSRRWGRGTSRARSRIHAKPTGRNCRHSKGCPEAGSLDFAGRYHCPPGR